MAPLLVVVVLHQVAGPPLTAAQLVMGWAAISGCLCLTWLVLSLGRVENAVIRVYRDWIMLDLAVCAAAVYFFTTSTWAAGIALVAWWAWLLAWLAHYEAGLALPRLWFLRLATMAVAVGVPLLLAQLESRFSEEEFFVALQAVQLALLWCVVAVVGRRLFASGPATPRPIPLLGWAPAATAGGLLMATVAMAVPAYWSSFFPAEAPAYPGISAETPFLCGGVEPEPVELQTWSTGDAIFADLVRRVAARPQKDILDYGMLAAALDDQDAAGAFHDLLLEEARAKMYSGQANSVKFIQNDAALRVYYLIRVDQAFPDLFTPDEWSEIGAWLRAVNERALTVEWVDWMYAAALAGWPEGPYENQENGLGLLSLLQVLDGARPEVQLGDLVSRNVDYLERNRRGWSQRFRNTDDAFIYQPIWIDNALFQSMYWGTTTGDDGGETRRRLSYEWLLYQALPDGGMLGYNHPALRSLALPAYQGAEMLDDPQLLWLSQRSLEWLATHDRPLPSWPGVETAANGLVAESPDAGSCLLYGDSGMPNQVGPLAPDKIVFRDGWSADSAFMLLNLRFSGWHRYKGTGSLTVAYQAGALAAESLSKEATSWLPVGRSQFRDKRVPRENVNGMQIPRSGFSQIVFVLAGAGQSPWAQDPPAYAQVEEFETLGVLDVVRISLDDWRGWEQRRSVYFVHNGPAVVIDEAESASALSRASVTWHVAGEGVREADGLWLRQGEHAARLALSESAWETTSVAPTASQGAGDLSPSWSLRYDSPTPGQLTLPAAFLWNGWADAVVEINSVPVQLAPATPAVRLALTGAEGRLTLWHNSSGYPLVDGQARIDGSALMVLAPADAASATICWVRATAVSVPLPWTPTRLTTSEGEAWNSRENWRWQEGALTFQSLPDESECVTVWEK